MTGKYIKKHKKHSSWFSGKSPIYISNKSIHVIFIILFFLSKTYTLLYSYIKYLHAEIIYQHNTAITCVLYVQYYNWAINKKNDINLTLFNNFFGL